MSGYPCAIHAIGRLQRSIKLDSIESLLDSLHRVSSIAFVTAEVIESMEGTKVEKYHMDRTEIIAYVSNITRTQNNFTPSEQELDLIAHLITSFEANNSAWMLQGGAIDGSQDLHQQVKSLYEKVLNSPQDMSLHVYSPRTSTIVPFNQLPQIEALTPHELESGKGKDVYTIYKYAMTRVIDHVYQLLLDKDAWYSFVSPRSKADVVTNLERAKTLRVFAVYCHSLLTYYQFFSVEMFMKSYDLVQDWILHFPPLDPTTLQNLEVILRKHDLLNARHDVDQLIDSFSNSSKDDLKAIVFPKEFVADFGLMQAVKRVESEAGKHALAGDLSNLLDLDKPEYLPLISGVAASSLDITYQLAQVLLTNKIVAEEIRKSLSILLPSMTGGTGSATIDRLKSLNIAASLPFTIPHATSYQVGSGARQGIRDGKLALDSGTPLFSWDFHTYVRDTLRFRLTTDTLIAKNYTSFSPLMLPDYDRAAELRGMLNYQWATLVPSSLFSGDKLYTLNQLKAHKQVIRELIETMSGVNYEIAIRELSLPHLRKVWATFISSFGLLYIRDKDASATDLDSLNLIIGHGQPYGNTYTVLESLQGVLDKNTELIEFGDHMYIRMHQRVPIVVDELRRDADFYSQRPTMYFASNSSNMEVSQWVLGEGLINFAMIPGSLNANVPSVKFTPKYAYLTQQLYINTDLYYKPSVSEPTRENYPITIHTTEWKDDRSQFFIDYKHFGSYLSPAGAIPGVSETTQLTEAVKKIEHAITTDVKEAEALTEKVGHAAGSTAKEIANEVSTANKAQNARIDAAKEETQSDL